MTPPETDPDNELFRQILESMTSGVMVLDGEGCIITSNTASADLLELKPDLLHHGMAMESFDITGQFRVLFQEMKETLKPVSRHEFQLGKGRESRVIGVSASLLRGTGDFNGAIFLFADITRVRELERTALLNRQLAQVGELTAGVVHELRNPLSIINGMAELLLRETGNSGKQQKKLECIRDEVRNLEQLVRKFLLFARPFEVRPREAPVRDILDRTLELCSHLAIEGKVDLIAEPPPPESLYTDPDLAAQALSNIVRNAVEEVEEGRRVNICYYRDENTPVFRVEDEGPGIMAENREDIFSPFFTKKAGGTGLGLSIVQRIVTILDGEVTCGNRPEGGAWFEIRLDGTA